jgi:hypothetical protein
MICLIQLLIVFLIGNSVANCIFDLDEPIYGLSLAHEHEQRRITDQHSNPSCDMI